MTLVATAAGAWPTLWHLSLPSLGSLALGGVSCHIVRTTKETNGDVRWEGLSLVPLARNSLPTVGVGCSPR